MIEQIRQVLADQARLTVEAAGIGESESLYDAGMTSHASVNVMLGLEDEFDVEFPDRMLRRDVFESITSICAALEEIRGEVAA